MRLREPTKNGENYNFGKLSGYDLDPPVPLTAEQSAQIQKLLQSSSSYWLVSKNCLPIYGVLYNFHSGKQTVRVALCFNCDILAVFTGEDTNQDEVGEENFDPAHRKFAAIAKSIFPNDSEIQGLK